MRRKDSTISNISAVSVGKPVAVPHYLSRISAGFPSPAEDFEENKLDLNELLIKHPSSTFFVTVSGSSMVGAGIFDKDILIVDRSLKAKHQDIVIAVVNGELTVKRLLIHNNHIELKPENSTFKPIIVREEEELSIWGVVTAVIHRIKSL